MQQGHTNGANRFAPVQNAGGHPKNGDQKMEMFGVKK